MTAAERLAIMHTMYGQQPDKRCSDCCNLVHPDGYYKCTRYGVTASQTTDWTSRGVACGKHNVPMEAGEPALRLLGVTRKIKARMEPEIDGQIRMEG